MVFKPAHLVKIVTTINLYEGIFNEDPDWEYYEIGKLPEEYESWISEEDKKNLF